MDFNNKHYHSLDLLRGISGYGVAICHFHAFVHQSTFFEYFSFLFVEFFFILSGFVLYPQLMEVLNNKKNLIIFYKRRWLRTIPLFIFCLILISVSFGELFSFNFFKYLFFIQDFFPNFLTNNYYPVVWSLAIEEFFYLIFPIVLIFFGRENLLKKILAFLAIIYIFKIILIGHFDSNFYRTGTFFRFDAIMIGFLLRFFLTKIDNKILLLLSLIFSLIVYYHFENFIVEKNENNLAKFLFVFGIQVISIITLLTFINFEKLIFNQKVKSFYSLISKQTYSVYLFHLILIHIMLKIGFTGNFSTLIFVLMLFVISSILYYFLELPFLKIRPKIIKQENGSLN